MLIPPGKKIYFLSDFHLGAPDRATSLVRERRIVAFLETIRRDAAAIFIVGDLFDFWYEYHTVVPKGYTRILGKMAEITDSGIPMHFFTGNHDMWMRGYFEQELNIPVYHEPKVFEYNGKKLLVGHGDGLGPGDHGYKFLKKIFRNRICQALFGILPPAVGVGIAGWLSRRSRAVTGSSDAHFLGEQREWLIAYCREVLKSRPIDFFIFGHRHLPIDFLLQPGTSRYINLGDWIRYYTYAVMEGEQLSLLSETPDTAGTIVPPMSYITSYTALLALTLAFCATTSAQQPAQQSAQQTSSTFTLTLALPQDIVDFTVDNLGNIYVLNADNQLKKLGPKGDSLAVFNDVRRYGKITRIDVTNPLKILVYYREFTTVIELDRFLNIVNTVDLRKQNILQAKAVALAYDNSIWVYDELDAVLKRIGDDGSLVDQTTDFRQLFDSVPDPTTICDQGGLVYLYDPAKGVYIFDHYGTLKTHLDLRGWQDFDVIGKNLLGRDDQRLYRYEPGTLNMLEEPIAAAYLGATHIHITPTILYVLKKTGLEVYSEEIIPRVAATCISRHLTPASHQREINIFAVYA